MTQIVDPTFYRGPAEAIAAPPERLAYVAADDPAGRAKDAMVVLDVDPASASHGQVVGWSELPTAGNELHHFGWNACSSALCHAGHGGHGPLERRYLIAPGLRSSRTMCWTPSPTPASRGSCGRSRPRSWPPRPAPPGPTPALRARAIFRSALGGADGDDGPGGVALLDHDSFEVLGAWERDRGEQFLADDLWWHLDHDTVITSEWATPR